MSLHRLAPLPLPLPLRSSSDEAPPLSCLTSLSSIPSRVPSAFPSFPLPPPLFSSPPSSPSPSSSWISSHWTDAPLNVLSQCDSDLPLVSSAGIHRLAHHLRVELRRGHWPRFDLNGEGREGEEREGETETEREGQGGEGGEEDEARRERTKEKSDQKWVLRVTPRLLLNVNHLATSLSASPSGAPSGSVSVALPSAARLPSDIDVDGESSARLSLYFVVFVEAVLMALHLDERSLSAVLSALPADAELLLHEHEQRVKHEHDTAPSFEFPEVQLDSELDGQETLQFISDAQNGIKDNQDSDWEVDSLSGESDDDSEEQQYDNQNEQWSVLQHKLLFWLDQCDPILMLHNITCSNGTVVPAWQHFNLPSVLSAIVSAAVQHPHMFSIASEIEHLRRKINLFLLLIFESQPRSIPLYLSSLLMQYNDNGHSTVPLLHETEHASQIYMLSSLCELARHSHSVSAQSAVYDAISQPRKIASLLGTLHQMIAEALQSPDSKPLNMNLVNSLCNIFTCFLLLGCNDREDIGKQLMKSSGEHLLSWLCMKRSEIIESSNITDLIEAACIASASLGKSFLRIVSDSDEWRTKIADLPVKAILIAFNQLLEEQERAKLSFRQPSAAQFASVRRGRQPKLSVTVVHDDTDEETSVLTSNKLLYAIIVSSCRSLCEDCDYLTSAGRQLVLRAVNSLQCFAKASHAREQLFSNLLYDQASFASPQAEIASEVTRWLQMLQTCCSQCVGLITVVAKNLSNIEDRLRVLSESQDDDGDERRMLSKSKREGEIELVMLRDIQKHANFLFLKSKIAQEIKHD